MFRAWDGTKMLENVPISAVRVGDNLEMRGTTLILMQYTGLKDKNGVEIYESDIVQHCNITKPFIVSIGGYIETYSEGHVANGIHLHTETEDVVLGVSAFNSDRNLEVIGNIYQNPELLANE